MTDNDIATAQEQLEQRRPANGRPLLIADLIPGAQHVEPAPRWPEMPSRPRPQRVILDTLDTGHPKVRYAVQMARAWAERKRAGHQDISLILTGPNGTGKTHIARAIWWSMVEQSIEHDGAPTPDAEPQPSGRFYASNDLLAKMGNSRDKETGIIVPVRAASVIGYPPMVVIDDVGAEQVIQFVGKEDQEAERHTRFFKAIDWCYTAQISVIVTSNLSIDELAQHLGRRSWDRLAQMAPKLPDGTNFMVDLSGVPSWRVKAGGR